MSLPLPPLPIKVPLSAVNYKNPSPKFPDRCQICQAYSVDPKNPQATACAVVDVAPWNSGICDLYMPKVNLVGAIPKLPPLPVLAGIPKTSANDQIVDVGEARWVLDVEKKNVF